MKAIIVVDVLNGFTREGPLASDKCAEVIPNIKKLLEKEEKEGSKIIFLADNHDRDDLEFKIFPPHCVKGSRESEVVDELKPFLKNGILIPKKRYSGFYNTNLEQILKETNPEKVIVVGVCTDICVLHTVADLRNRDYEVEVPKDCVETYDAPGHSAAEIDRFSLDHMRDILGAKITQT